MIEAILQRYLQFHNLKSKNNIIFNDKSEKIGVVYENKYVEFNDKNMIKISDLLLFLLEGEIAHA